MRAETNTDTMMAPCFEHEGSFGDPAVIDDLLERGTVVGGYEIEDELGGGTMGIVYAAIHPVIRKRVAIKVLRQHGDAAALDRFLLEARSVNEVSHPNIVDIFDFGTLPDGRAYLVMDLLVGETLGARVARGPMSIAEVAKIANECAAALAAAHAKELVHRNLKPANVFLVAIPNSRRIAIKLLDFGLAKLIRPDAGVRTRTGATAGAADYLSPEAGRGRDIDHRSDIYALGAMIFHMLSGRLPYPRTSFLDALVAHAEAPVPSLRAIMPGVPKQLAHLVEAMIAKDPDRRPDLVTVRAVLRKFKLSDSASLETVEPPASAAPPAPPVSQAAPAARSVSLETRPGFNLRAPRARDEHPTRELTVPNGTPPRALPVVPSSSDFDDDLIEPTARLERPIDAARLVPRAVGDAAVVRARNPSVPPPIPPAGRRTPSSPIPAVASTRPSSPIPVVDTARSSAPIPAVVTTRPSSPIPATRRPSSPVPVVDTARSSAPIPTVPTRRPSSPIPAVVTTRPSSPIPATRRPSSPIPVVDTARSSAPIPTVPTRRPSSPIPVVDTARSSAPIPTVPTRRPSSPIPVAVATTRPSSPIPVAPSSPIPVAVATTRPSSPMLAFASEAPDASGAPLREPRTYPAPAAIREPAPAGAFALVAPAREPIAAVALAPVRAPDASSALAVTGAALTPGPRRPVLAALDPCRAPDSSTSLARLPAAAALAPDTLPVEAPAPDAPGSTELALGTGAPRPRTLPTTAPRPRTPSPSPSLVNAPLPAPITAISRAPFPGSIAAKGLATSASRSPFPGSVAAAQAPAAAPRALLLRSVAAIRAPFSTHAARAPLPVVAAIHAPLDLADAQAGGVPCLAPRIGTPPTRASITLRIVGAPRTFGIAVVLALAAALVAVMAVLVL